jgi:hypothetical protein
MTRILVQVPGPLKAKLDALWAQGFSIARYIRALLERELRDKEAPPHGR